MANAVPCLSTRWCSKNTADVESKFSSIQFTLASFRTSSHSLIGMFLSRLVNELNQSQQRMGVQSQPTYITLLIHQEIKQCRFIYVAPSALIGHFGHPKSFTGRPKKDKKKITDL
ncbi:hypothetical protein ILYODFUR_031634 [Ilyodon furcidens]|uniref:Uncharacterized protein n=1 Tax=Ilyodon furcidens TaxID=33524 RepID=A0ABV0VL84_9TELE